MKLLFYYRSERVFHDNEGNIYTSGNFTPEVWKRYLDISEELHVVMTDTGITLSREEAEKTKQRIDTTCIHMHLIPDVYSSLKSYFSFGVNKKVKDAQKEVFELSDFAIIRACNSRAIRKYRKTGKPYAIEVVGCPWDAFWNHDIKGKIMAPYEYLYSKHEVARAPFVLYVTKEFLQKRYPTKGKTINCSNVSLNPPNESILTERLKKIQTGSDKVIIGTAAALNVRYKGQQYVIEALARLKEKGITNIEYQLVGGGDASYLKSVAGKMNVSDSVRVIGQLPHDRVFEWLKSIDLYIQPSLQEGLPRSVIEAMSYGVPCAGTSIAGIPELLDKDMMFKGKNVKGIVNIIESSNKEKMIEQAKKNYEIAKDYDVKTLKERRNRFYQDFKEYSEAKGIDK